MKWPAGCEGERIMRTWLAVVARTSNPGARESSRPRSIRAPGSAALVFAGPNRLAAFGSRVIRAVRVDVVAGVRVVIAVPGGVGVVVGRGVAVRRPVVHDRRVRV